MREMSSYHHIFRPRYPRQRFKIHLKTWMYHWGAGDDVSWLVPNFLRSFKYFWRNHKGSKSVEAISNTKKNVFFLTERFILQPNPTTFLPNKKRHKNRSPRFFSDSWTLGFTFSDTNTNKKTAMRWPWDYGTNTSDVEIPPLFPSWL